MSGTFSTECHERHSSVYYSRRFFITPRELKELHCICNSVQVPLVLCTCIYTYFDLIPDELLPNKNRLQGVDEDIKDANFNVVFFAF